MPHPKLMVMVLFCWKMNFLPSKIKNKSVLLTMSSKLMIEVVAFFLGHPVYWGNAYNPVTCIFSVSLLWLNDDHFWSAFFQGFIFIPYHRYWFHVGPWFCSDFAIFFFLIDTLLNNEFNRDEPFTVFRGILSESRSFTIVNSFVFLVHRFQLCRIWRCKIIKRGIGIWWCSEYYLTTNSFHIYFLWLLLQFLRM